MTINGERTSSGNEDENEKQHAEGVLRELIPWWHGSEKGELITIREKAM